MNQFVRSTMFEPAVADFVQVRHIVIRDLRLLASIGVYEHEHGSLQPIIINVDVCASDEGPHNDDLGSTICYDLLMQKIQTVAASGHINLVETLADRIADIVLDDPRAACVKVSVEKPKAIRAARSVGVEITRCRVAGANPRACCPI